MNLAELRTDFVATTAALGATRNQVLVFEKLAALYKQPHRAYHTLEHISHGLELLDTHARLLLQPNVVRLAFWFHDAVYSQNPLTNNELASAQLAEAACEEMGIKSGIASRVRTLVLATKTHELPHGIGPGDDQDLEAMLDIDLSILAADPLTFARFERDIRTEFAWVPEVAFLPARAKVLRKFLERSAVPKSGIFKRSELAALWEADAVRNLSELAVLLEHSKEAVHASASPAHVWATNLGRLVACYAWQDLYQVTLTPRGDGTLLAAELVFHSARGPGIAWMTDDEKSVTAMTYLRGVCPKLDEYQQNAARSGAPALAYAKEKNGAVVPPVVPIAGTTLPSGDRISH
jgi:predicted metal-dependent HD superfamily phosphohydrolase